MKIIITPTAEQAAFAAEFLSRETEDPSCEDVPLVLTANFGGGIEADIKLCNGDSPYVDAVLFKDGHEVDVLEVSDSLEGEYPFEYEGVEYLVEVAELEGGVK